MARLTVVTDDAAVAARAGGRIAELIAQSIAERGRALLCLTGGRIARRVYEQLAAAPVDWQHVHLFWGDERHVPPDHPDSNFGMASQALISRVPIPPEQIHRIPAELPDAAGAAREYEEQLRDVMFDVVLLGVGEDGHIASLFPGDALLGSDPIHGSYQGVESGREGGLTPLVAATQARLAPQHTRITLTPGALLNARAILVIVSGSSKANAVHAALRAPDDVATWPVHLLRAADDRVEWVIDEAAASRL